MGFNSLAGLVHLPVTQRRKRMGLPDGDTDPALDDMSDGEYEFDEEPEELVEARQRLAAYTARPGEEEPAGGAWSRAHAGRGSWEVAWLRGPREAEAYGQRCTCLVLA